MATTIQPIYTANTCIAAYQLNWSVALFAKAPLPPVQEWQDPLRAAVESCAPWRRTPRRREGREIRRGR
jgi:hypothetical protein